MRFSVAYLMAPALGLATMTAGLVAGMPAAQAGLIWSSTCDKQVAFQDPFATFEPYRKRHYQAYHVIPRHTQKLPLYRYTKPPATAGDAVRTRY
jgi:hypothetical protein